MKNGTKIISLLLAVLMLVTAIPITAFAAGGEVYLKELRISTAKTADKAKKFLTDNGYTVLDANLNERTNKDCVYIGYKTTTNPDEAITDLSLMQMEGGYSYADYEEMVEKMRTDVDYLIDSISAAIDTARENYQNGYLGALKAAELLNMFVEDDSGKNLGELIFVESIDRSILQRIFLEGNSDITKIIYNMLALACVNIGDETSWLAKLEGIDVYGDYDPLVYSDLADRIFSSYMEIYDLLEYYDKYCKEFNENPESFEDLDDEELIEYLPEDYERATFVYATLSSYKFAGGTAADFFGRDPYEVDTEELYPLLAAMTPAERDVAVLVGFVQMIVLAQNDADTLNAYLESYKEEIEYFDLDGKISVYTNVDRSLFDGGVALTTAALRASASTGENPWYSEKNINKGLSVALGCISGTSIATAIYTACRSRKLINASKFGQRIISDKAFLSTIKGANTKALSNVSKQFLQRGIVIESVIPNYATLDITQVMNKLPSEIRLQHWSIVDDAVKDSSKAIDAAMSKAKAEIAAAGRRTLMSVSTIIGVAVGISMLVEAIRIGIKLYNQYHVEFEDIPRILVDEVVTDTDSYNVNYYAVKDHNGEAGDLNAWGGLRWNALYTTTDTKAGDPIIASSLMANNASSFPSDDHGAVHYFGETAAANVNRYNRRSTAPEIYMFYKRDVSLSMTASTFSTGEIVMFSGFGLLGGILIGSLGALGTVKLRKKKEDADSNPVT